MLNRVVGCDSSDCKILSLRRFVPDAQINAMVQAASGALKARKALESANVVSQLVLDRNKEDLNQKLWTGLLMARSAA
jgi:hypothetical protein